MAGFISFYTVKWPDDSAINKKNKTFQEKVEFGSVEESIVNAIKFWKL